MNTSLSNKGVEINEIHVCTNNTLSTNNFTINDSKAGEAWNYHLKILRKYMDCKNKNHYWYKKYSSLENKAIKKERRKFYNNNTFTANSSYLLSYRYNRSFNMISDKEDYFYYLRKYFEQKINPNHISLFLNYCEYTFDNNYSFLFSFIYVEPIKKQNQNNPSQDLCFKIDLGMYKKIINILNTSIKTGEIEGNIVTEIDHSFLLSCLKILLFFELDYTLQAYTDYDDEEIVPDDEESVEHRIYKTHNINKSNSILTYKDLVDIACYKIDNAVVSHILISDTLTSKSFHYQDYFYELKQLTFPQNITCKVLPQRQILEYRFDNINASQYDYKPIENTNIKLKFKEESLNTFTTSLSLFKMENIQSFFNLTTNRAEEIFNTLNKNLIEHYFYLFIKNQFLHASKEFSTSFNTIKKSTFPTDVKFAKELNKKGARNTAPKVTLALTKDHIQVDLLNSKLKTILKERQVENFWKEINDLSHKLNKKQNKTIQKAIIDLQNYIEMK